MSLIDQSVKDALVSLVNRHGVDAQLSIPDYILGEHLFRALVDLAELKVSLLKHGLEGENTGG